jgi:ribosomal protein L11 methyltransferase
MNERWHALVFRVPREIADGLAAELGALGRGVESRRLDHRDEEIRAFLTSRDQAPVMRAWAERGLERLGVDSGATGMRIEEVEDGRWVERYQESLQPFTLGRRFTVHPRGRVEVEDGRAPLLLIPGRAFGTGEHATTQLCAEQLEDLVDAGSRWVDLGCGTGILLLVAIAGGAREALGVEIDPDAVDVAREVLAGNGAGERATVLCGGLEQVERGVWDGAICNISSTFSRMHVADLAELPRPGGVLLVSGVLEEDLDGLAADFSRAGMREIERRTRRPWGLLSLERREIPAV